MGTRNALLFAVSALTLSACAALDSEHATDRPGEQAEQRPVRAEHPALYTGRKDEDKQAAEAAETDDLWERVRRGFAYGDVEHERIDAAVNMYAGSHGYLDNIAEGAAPYLHYIVEQVEARDMPLEIALIPAVESGFRPDARSSMAASGIWQFMPMTAEARGLRTTALYDGRKDVIASTEAALDYLEMLHGMFDDWFLALAAYNAGHGTVQRAIRQNAQAGRSTDYWNLSLPAETQRYVPRILAVAELIRNPQQHNLTLEPLPNEAVLAVVETDGGQINLSKAAEIAGTDTETLRKLNPGLNQAVTDPNGPHRLAVPAEAADTFAAQLAQIPRDERVAYQHYEVRSGDSLSAIASRHGTSVAAIRQANGRNGDVIRAGEQLLIPAGADSQPVAEAQGVEQYTVQRGDSLSVIAQRFGVSTKEIRNWNDLDRNHTLHPGQTLTMRTNGRTAQR
ncbi:LysM peptidoglycan-binding domain-containing protein [Methylonatrum kenyense]|uniref:LysM peptidoglycan-binding domain-containing protein n=1 Tax=Methylonatrum kenyense TaxID=455253 RepID=UPI0020BF3CA6|nr:LysM peptidoglycan-binding domain-containing protein [Methylonatrum kenyense]MCK8515117.1 LysM peptidoglycan-binding domain-containing protein [Methylonatrum kenyense]